ncbi:MAG: prepilin-type N-terminal cleavage/methylation domain-containing protein, partial [Alphaproteobacteria bacterium]|nr:prepilin-type N-terminal cleavage/methylation domain-containing protein [Alphaproteobacteria bacterium]
MRNLKIKNTDCHAALAMTKNAQSGRSMIEMLGVLAIIGVLSVGGIAGYSKAMTKYRINKTIEQITLIAGNVRTFFAPQRNYDGLDNINNKW